MKETIFCRYLREHRGKAVKANHGLPAPQQAEVSQVILVALVRHPLEFGP